jgi:hypothetical protein
VTEEFFEKLFCCTKISFVRARVHSLPINIFGLERISTLPEEYRLQKKINFLSVEIYLLPAKMSNKYQNFTEDISFVEEELSSVREENHIQKKIFTSCRRLFTGSGRTNSSVADEILLSLHLLLQKIRFLGVGLYGK